jgi:hypothetical protein
MHIQEENKFLSVYNSEKGGGNVTPGSHSLHVIATRKAGYSFGYIRHI